MDSTINKKRKKAYFVAASILVGILVLWAAYFSYANGWEKLSFSYEDGDVYEIDSTILESLVPIDGHQELTFQVFIDDHYTLHYFRAEAEGIGDKDITMDLIGSSTENGYSEPVSIHCVRLHDGINNIEIPSDDFSYLTIRIDGADTPVLKSAELRESIELINDDRSHE